MKRIMVYHNHKKESIEVKEKLIKLLTIKEFVVTTQKPHLIIVIGGDGTMISAIRKYRKMKVPFVGVNTGSLGFLPSLTPENFDCIIDIIKHNNYKIQSYPLLDVKCRTVNGDVIESYAFNEVLIKHVEPRLMEAKVYLDTTPFNYFTGDGFIVSTPIGTTGYSIWAGGCGIHSDLPVYEITPLHPNDNSINRPLKNSLVVPIATKLDISIVKAKFRAVIVACDGRKISDDYISEIHVCASNKEIKILRWGEYNYFELYRDKIIDKKINKLISKNQADSNDYIDEFEE